MAPHTHVAASSRALRRGSSVARPGIVVGRLCLLLACVLGATATACDRTTPERTTARDDAAEAQAPPSPPRVAAEREGLIYRYRKADGAYASAESIDDVPGAARAEVIVYDPQHDPAGWFFVADLREAGPDGAYPVRAVAAAAMAAASAPAAPRSSTASRGRVVRLYSASWCGACRTARAFLEREKIPFVEKDVEKDRGARAEIAAAARRAGVPEGSLTGVPVFVIGEHVFMGFDAARVRRLAGRG